MSKEIFDALAKAQGEMGTVHKDKNNPHYKSKYASLDIIIEMARPILAKHGLSVVQTPILSGQECGVKTTICHSSGESLDCGELLLPLGRGGGAQGAGSSITYARRYALSAVLNIATDEDVDAHEAQKSRPVAVEPKPATEDEISKALAWVNEKGVTLEAEILGRIEARNITNIELKDACALALRLAKKESNNANPQV